MLKGVVGPLLYVLHFNVRAKVVTIPSFGTQRGVATLMCSKFEIWFARCNSRGEIVILKPFLKRFSRMLTP